MPCTNCDGPLPEGHGVHDESGEHWFCDLCAAYIDALTIGAREPVFLYDSNERIMSWTGGILGFVTKRTVLRASFQPVRYRVRMLDGSHWYGTGPRENGTYVRLRPMKEK